MSGLDEMAPGMVPAMDDAKAPLPGASAPRIAYFVHDLDDPAVHRRIGMLRAGTEDITLIGFRRSGSSTATVEGIIPFELGRNQDARLIRRARSVLKAALLLGRGRRSMVGRTVFVARTLEMLVLASLARRRYAPQAPLVYECLDIHRLMTSPSRAGAMLRWVERRLMRLCAMLVTSSPGFVREYFTPVHHRLPPVCVLENRVLASELNGGLLNTRERAGTLSESHADAPAAPPWRIGWFGVIRCQRSLQLLAAVARRLPGQVEVVIRVARHATLSRISTK